jgi:hypothetical protein
MKFVNSKKKRPLSWATVAHNCYPSYLADRCRRITAQGQPGQKANKTLISTGQCGGSLCNSSYARGGERRIVV